MNGPEHVHVLYVYMSEQERAACWSRVGVNQCPTESYVWDKRGRWPEHSGAVLSFEQEGKRKCLNVGAGGNRGSDQNGGVNHWATESNVWSSRMWKV
jgi:hypothetical protein